MNILGDKFIYVFDEETKQQLLDKGYELLKHAENTYVFINKKEINFSLDDERKFVLSNSLVL